VKKFVSLRAWRIIGALLALMLFAVPTTALGAQPQEAAALILIDDGVIAPGVTINALDVSGLGAKAAEAIVVAYADEAAEDAVVVLTLPERTIEVPLSAFGAAAQPVQAVERAMRIGRSGSVAARIQERDDAKRQGVSLYIPYTFDEQTLRAALTATANDIPRETSAGSFTFDPSLPERFVIVEGVRGFTPDEQGLYEAVTAAFASGAIHDVVVPGTPAADNGETILKPGTAENTVLVGKFTTKVDGSSGRIANVRTGTEMINGKVVQPGEVFSCNDVLGPRNKAAGIWKMAPALLNGQSVMELGGGICQVSTTLFNAAIRANLEMVEWVHHSIPSSYVTIGCDATISTGGPDFRFKNNTDWPVYIVGYYEEKGRKLTFEIWGQPLPDGMSIEITGRQVGTKGMPAAQYTAKSPEEEFKGRIGRYSETYMIWYDADGKELRRELIKENYYPARAPILMPKPASTPTPAPAPPADGA
jgi:vancomycin resistance protein YoaR